MIRIDTAQTEKSIDALVRELFPIHRTLVNEGYKKSVDILKKQLPFEVLTIPSGTEVFDWTVPKSWNVEYAWIKDLKGNVLVDFSDNNLHLSAYSQEFSGRISKKELLEHLNFREDLPAAIPYNFHYYKPQWSFNVSFDFFQKNFLDEEYEVEIRTNVFDDDLRVAEVFIPGKSKEEVLITSYMCHPSMVNDNLSGVVVATELFKYLIKAEDLKYSYRLIIIPETIGAVSFLSQFPEKHSNVIAGLTVYCCGYGDRVHYKRTYSESSLTDKVAGYALEYFYKDESTMLPFWPGGSDERQFNSPGVRMPMGALTRTPAAEFKQYHTSLDNLELLDASTLANTLSQLVEIVNVLESDETYENNYRGEPCFSKHNISYPTFNDALSKSSAYMVKILANEIDGSNSLLDIAMKWDLNIHQLAQVAKEFLNKNLVKIKS